MIDQKFQQLIMRTEKKKTSMIKTSLSNEYEKYKSLDEVEKLKNKTLGSPFTTRMPLQRWQGKTSSILKLDLTNEKEGWIYFHLEDPESYQTWICQSSNKAEIIFFSQTNQKYYRLANECLYWSYYASGPFQRLEGGVWVPISDQTPTENDITIIEGQKEAKFKLNNLTGLLERIKNEKEGTKSEISEDKEEEDSQKAHLTSISSSDFHKALEKVKADRIKEASQKPDKDAFKKIDPILEDVNKNAEYQVWKEAIMKGEDVQPPTIKSNKIVQAFEEISEIYGFNYENLRQATVSKTDKLFPLESMNDLKFTLGVLLPELCLYSPSFLKTIHPKKILFCGNVFHIDKVTSFKMSSDELIINCKERNIMKIQKGFHQAIFQLMYNVIIKLLPEVEPAWNALNPPDFNYDLLRTKVPRGIKGFISFNATLSTSTDINEIYFTLIKDPNTILNHRDIIIAKKGHLLKQVLEAVWPGALVDAWWDRVKSYKDIIEHSLGATDYYKEAKFDEDEVEDDK